MEQADPCESSGSGRNGDNRQKPPSSVFRNWIYPRIAQDHQPEFEFNSVEKTLNIDFWEDFLSAPTTVDWTEKATYGEFKAPENNTRIQLIMAVDGNDAIAKDRPALLQDYISEEVAGTRNGIAKDTMQFSTMLADSESWLAICKQEGNSSQFPQDAKPSAHAYYSGMELPICFPGRYRH